jgi:plastocyanin
VRIGYRRCGFVSVLVSKISQTLYLTRRNPVLHLAGEMGSRAQGILLLAALTAGVAIAAGAASTSSGSGWFNDCPADSQPIAIRGDFSFYPDPANAPGPTPICWTNTDTVTHRVVSDTGVFDSGDLAPGEGYLFTFNAIGSYAYHDVIYPSMAGTVQVDTGPSQCASGNGTEPIVFSPYVGHYASRQVMVPWSTVCWMNQDVMTHRIVADSGAFESGDILPGQTYSFSFNSPGTYGYHEELDPSRSATITVRPTERYTCPPATALVDMNRSYGYSPSILSVTSGTTVCWRNPDGWGHTVTADNGAFDSGTIALGATYLRKFDTPGVWNYHDALYPSSTGSVHVDTPPPTASSIVVPRVVGLKLAMAKKRIRRARGKVGRVLRVRSKRVGRVIRQKPVGGRKLRRGSRVTLVVGRR